MTTLTRAECYFAPRRHRRQLGKWMAMGERSGDGVREGKWRVVAVGGRGAGHSAGRAVILN